MGIPFSGSLRRKFPRAKRKRNQQLFNLTPGSEFLSFVGYLNLSFDIAYLPKVSVEREVEEGRICEIQTALPKIDLGVILLKNSNHAESSAASLFSKLVKNELYDGKMDRSDFFSRTCLMHRTPNEC